MKKGGSIIRIKHLSKHFREVKAIDGIDLKVRKGIYGLIGPNGAGKTTLIKLILGLIRPSNGSIYIGNDVPGTPEANSRIGYLSENQGYYDEKSPLEYLSYFARIYGIPKDEIEVRIEKVLKKVKLDHRKNSTISTFSRGMRQRLGISRAILHDPQLILLDEPLSGLDPTGRKDVLNTLEILKNEGCTAIISSHELKDMDTLCDRLCVMKNGKIIAEGTPTGIISNISEATQVLQYRLHSPSKEYKRLVKEVPKIKKVELKGEVLRVTIEHDADLERTILRWLLDNNIDFTPEKHVIDSIYSQLIKEEG